ncbi:hypothetical protein [Streptomyces sp. NPDC004629]|uniref:hypothetical protein n=1 Tax=Streptomyces sp. NPDC004629 TaxID=3364705 RepID=UPI00368E8C93
MIDKEAASPAQYRGLILDFGGVLTTHMRLNGQAFEKAEGLRPGAYFEALNENPEGVAIGIDPTDLVRRCTRQLASGA